MLRGQREVPVLRGHVGERRDFAAPEPLDHVGGEVQTGGQNTLRRVRRNAETSLGDRPDRDGDERVAVTGHRGRDRAGAPPLPAQILALPVALPDGGGPLQVTVSGEHQCGTPRGLPLGDRGQVRRHHRVTQTGEPGHPRFRRVGHPGVITQQAGRGAGVQPGPVPLLAGGGGDQPRRLRVHQRGEVVGEQPQGDGLDGTTDRRRRVHGRGGIGPAFVGPHQPVDLDGRPREQRGIEVGGEVTVQRGQRTARARGVHQLQRAVEAVEPQAVGGGLVVLPHPRHQLAINRRDTPPVTEPRGHDVVESARAAGHPLIDDQPREAVALDRDRPVHLVFDELAEHAVAHQEELLHAVRGFAQAEQPRAGREGVQEVGEIHAFDRIPEQPVETGGGTCTTGDLRDALLAAARSLVREPSD